MEQYFRNTQGSDHHHEIHCNEVINWLLHTLWCLNPPIHKVDIICMIGKILRIYEEAKQTLVCILDSIGEAIPLMYHVLLWWDSHSWRMDSIEWGKDFLTFLQHCSQKTPWKQSTWLDRTTVSHLIQCNHIVDGDDPSIGIRSDRIRSMTSFYL